MKMSSGDGNVNYNSKTRKLYQPQIFGNHEEYLSRISKSLYYVRLPKSERTSLPVTELAAEIFSETKKSKLSLQYLDTEEAAKISLNACVSPCSMVLALLYLDRLKAANPKYLAKVSPSELFLVSLLIGSKFLEDEGVQDEVMNDEWAASAGISVQDINRAEREFLNAIDWEVFVNQETFWKQFKSLERKVSLKESNKRGGWFTYTDMNALLEIMEIARLVQTMFAVTAVCVASYTASVLVMVGSTALVSHFTCSGLSSQLTQQHCFLPDVLPSNETLQDESSLPYIDDITNETSDSYKSWSKQVQNYVFRFLANKEYKIHYNRFEWQRPWTDTIRTCFVERTDWLQGVRS